MKNPTLKIIKKYHDPLLILGACLLVLVGGALAKYPEWVRVWADPISPDGGVRYEEIIKEVPVDCKTEKCQILSYIVEKFGDDAANAITLINKCENHSFSQSAQNVNKNGSVDYGIFQVNSVHVKRYGNAFMYDWKANVDVAYEIYKSAGYKFTPWSCSYTVGQTNYYGRSK